MYLGNKTVITAELDIETIRLYTVILCYRYRTQWQLSKL